MRKEAVQKRAKPGGTQSGEFDETLVLSLMLHKIKIIRRNLFNKSLGSILNN